MADGYHFKTVKSQWFSNGLTGYGKYGMMMMMAH